MEHENNHQHHEHKEENRHKEHHHEHGGGHHDHHAMMVADFRRRFWISLVVSIPVILLSPTIQSFFGLEEVFEFSWSDYLSYGLSTFIFFFGGYPFLKGFFEEVKEKAPGMMTLIAVAITIAYGFSTAVVFGFPGKVFFWELVTLIDIMLLGHWIEMKSVSGASKALEEMAKMMPSEAHKIGDNGDVKDVKSSKLKNGDKVLVKPGESIPADGKIYDGSTEINESMVTGESVPVTKEEGDEVIGGSVNGDFAIKIEITGSGNESYLSKVMEIVSSAQENKSKSARLADKAAFWLTIVALTSGTVTLLYWWLLGGEEINYAITRAVTVMIITCPHALGLAVPLVIAVSTGKLATNGMLVRKREAFEDFRKVKAVVFDKTGTLTKGEFEIDEVKTFSGEDKDELLKLAASAEAESEHPIAKGISKEIDNLYDISDFEVLRGEGVKAEINGKTIFVVSRKYIRENDLELPEDEDKQGTTVYVVREKEVLGSITLKDKVRESAESTFAELRKKGIKTIILTGDSEGAAKEVADKLKPDEYYAEVKPEEKSEHIKRIREKYGFTAMTGDGVNDAPALAVADAGIAIGSGTDVAVETADIVLVKNEPSYIPVMIEFSEKTYSKMKQNLFWATAYNIIAIPLAAGVLSGMGIVLSPAAGAVMMSLSTVVVAINAKILKLNHQEKEK